ncbi:MAG: hypothetical protein HYZ17_08625 [Betaproteobacteria bacterium]|nr:hypothetical protein [Betaproteobacteria bacterium]
MRTAEGWRDAQLIKAGGQLDLKGSTDERPKRAEVVKVEHELKHERVYNLEVANAHTFFVGEEGVWGHNATAPRCKWWKQTLWDAWNALPSGSNGQKVCPRCGKQIGVPPFSGVPRDWHAHHTPAWSKRCMENEPRSVQRANYQTGVSGLCPRCNMSLGDREK